MRLFVFISIVFLLPLNLEAQIQNRRIWTHPEPMIELNVSDYVYDHFEIGGGGQVLIIIPGIHAKLRYAPINYERIKVIGEIRGEGFMAPIADWSYHIKVGTNLEEDIGIYAGFGRSHYIWQRRNFPDEPYVDRVFQNTFELGIRWQSIRRQWDVWTSLPLHTDNIPLFTVGVSVTTGGLWDFKDQKWFLPQRK